MFWGTPAPCSATARALVNVRMFAQDCFHLVHHLLQGNIREQEAPQGRFQFYSARKKAGPTFEVVRGYDALRNPSNRLSEVEGVCESDESRMLKTMQPEVPALSLRRTGNCLDPTGDRIVNGVSNSYSTSEGHGYGTSTHEARFSGARYDEVFIVGGRKL